MTLNDKLAVSRKRLLIQCHIGEFSDHATTNIAMDKAVFEPNIPASLQSCAMSWVGLQCVIVVFPVRASSNLDNQSQRWLSK